jgi:hypothetical protein
MAQKIDPSELASFKEFMLTNAIQLDAITQLLIDHNIITQEEFVSKLKQVQADYLTRQRS